MAQTSSSQERDEARDNAGQRQAHHRHPDRIGVKPVPELADLTYRNQKRCADEQAERTEGHKKSTDTLQDGK